HGTSLTAILAAAIIDVRAPSHSPGRSPYSTATIVRWTHDQVELLILGDSLAVIGRACGSTELVSDDRLEPTAPDKRTAYRHHLRRGGGFDAPQHPERHSFNRPGGFWVAEADPTAPTHAVQRTMPTTDLAIVTLLTDGARRRRQRPPAHRP